MRNSQRLNRKERNMMGTLDRTYAINHGRVRSNLGNAKLYHCVDCNGDAYEWSQTHGTDGSSDGHFLPRCRSCHSKYDPVKSKPCEPGCICAKHTNGGHSSACKPGCVCGRHIAKTSRKCEPNCKCGRHLNGRNQYSDR